VVRQIDDCLTFRLDFTEERAWVGLIGEFESVRVLGSVDCYRQRARFESD